MIEIKKGTIDDFFLSAKKTAEEIDKKEKITPKKIIWVETDDFNKFLKPSRVELIRYLRKKKEISLSSLLKELHKSPSSLNRDLELLAKYGLIEVASEINAGHGRRKVIVSLFEGENFELRTAVE